MRGAAGGEVEGGSKKLNQFQNTISAADLISVLRTVSCYSTRRALAEPGAAESAERAFRRASGSEKSM